MNVLEEKRKLNSYIYDKVQKLKFKNVKINLAGSAALQSQRYFSDYDFNSIIKRKYKPKTLFDEFNQILIASVQSLFFIELKFEYLDGTKKKIYDIIEIKPNMFKNLNYIKIDYLLWFDYHFKELSIMYIFKNTKYGVEDIEKDYDELVSSGNYYKALKRLFSIYKLTKNHKEAVILTKYFNSDYGKLYSMNSNLKTLLLVPSRLKKQIDINLKFLGLSPSINIQNEIQKNDEILNKESEKYLV